MASIKCPKCAHQVEPSMQECPKCGVIFKKYQQGVLKAQKVMADKAKQAHIEQSKRLTTCSACNNTISKLASSCPRCGQPHQPISPLEEDEEKASGYFDYEFNRFITPQLIKIIYIFVLVIGFIGCLGGVISSLFNPFEPVQIFISIISYLFLVLMTRIACESVLLLFKIEENTRR